jgi:hypothetical protein
MPRRVYDAKQRQLAYSVWYAANRNATEALRRLEADYGWPLSRTAIFDWMAEENWGARADAQDADARRAAEQEQFGRKGILVSLLRQKERYDSYFQELDAAREMDHAATSAYTQLLRVIDTYQGKTVDKDAETQKAAPKTGGLTDEVLAEIEARIGLR